MNILKQLGGTEDPASSVEKRGFLEANLRGLFLSLASDANFCPGGAIIFENTAHFDRPPSAGWETIYFEFFEANSSRLKNVFFLFSYFIYCIRESVAILIPLGSNCGISFSDSIVSSYSY